MATRKNVAPKPEGDQAPSFEQALGRLEEIVQELEGGELTLEESLARYEEGMGLSKRLSKTLDEAEKRIERLTQNEETPTTEPLELDLEKNAREPEAEEGELPF